MGWRLLNEYALIGDTRTAALVSRSGSIDWLCLPRFDSRPAFGALIDPDRGGIYRVAIAGAEIVDRSYRGATATVETTWETASGRAVTRDALVLDASSSLRPLATVVRSAECVRGEVELEVVYRPRFGLPGAEPIRRRLGRAFVAEHDGTAMAWDCDPPLELDAGGRGRLRLEAGARWYSVLGVVYKSPLVLVPPRLAADWVAMDENWWDGWTADIEYTGPFRAALARSLVTLRLLTFSPSGAVVASPTTSLPEAIGQGRNWDYRYAWPRDASLASGAFTAAGKLGEARAFLNWLIHTTRLTRPRIEVLYTLDGTRSRGEREIAGVAGYRGSRPVRTGNAAATQHQLDVYGWVIDAGWHLHTAGEDLDGLTWSMLADFADFARDRWRLPDAGIWEVRGDARHHTSSKLMAWLALDRAARMAEDRGSDEKRSRAWRRASEELRAWILEHCVDGGHLVQAAGHQGLDASTLLLGMTEMVEPGHRLVPSTIETVRRALGGRVPGTLYRYGAGTDGLAGEEACFLPCSFWLVEALARAGQVDEAERVMAGLLPLAGEVGLLAEEVTSDGRELLGNLPLAFSHATLVRAAFAIEAARSSTTASGARPAQRRTPRARPASR